MSACLQPRKLPHACSLPWTLNTAARAQVAIYIIFIFGYHCCWAAEEQEDDEGSEGAPEEPEDPHDVMEIGAEEYDLEDDEDVSGGNDFTYVKAQGFRVQTWQLRASRLCKCGVVCVLKLLGAALRLGFWVGQGERGLWLGGWWGWGQWF